jgi:hypothetical protein
MPETLAAPKAGDKCPIDGGAFVKRAQPTDAQRTAAKDRDNPVPLPPFVDSADPVQVHELGELYVCSSCGYRTRIKPDAAPAPRDQKAGE